MTLEASDVRAGVIVVGLALSAILGVHALHQCGVARERAAPSVTLESKHAHYTLFRDGRIRIETVDGARTIEGDLIGEDDQSARVIALDDLASDGPARAHAGAATFDVDVAHDALEITFNPNSDAGSSDVGIRLVLAGRVVFLSGRGELGDVADESGKLATIEDVLHPIGVVARGEEMSAAIEQASAKNAALRVMRPAEDAKITLAIGNASGVWPLLFEHAKMATKRVKGNVTGAPGTSHVVGLDAEGSPILRIATDVAGHFDFGAPETVTSWYASASATRTSAPVIYPPGTAWDLKLDVSDGGEVHVRTLDADTKAPLTARLIVHGIDGTLDPSFGPDYRASGAGPIIDALRGEITTPLPAGKYRIAATKGIEWTIDTRVIQVEPGKRVDVELAPRHVVPTPDEIGCDLHVHARPSFDAPVTAEDRVLSLVAAGIDFAVPTEHNLIGNYAPSIKVLGVESELAFVPGVEVTTYMPKFGHFGVFPWQVDKPPPPFKNTDIAKVFAGARAGDAKRILIVHHPRLTREIGYFTAFGWKPGGPIPIALRTDFDAVEVYNGYESASLDHVEVVLADYYALLNAGHRYTATGSSDSHRIQYQWAGYPRTMVRADASDPLAVVAAIKAGHATVTSGPIIELDLQGTRPGGDLVMSPRTVLGRLVVRAAPWVDVTSANVIVGGRIAQTFDIPTRPMTTGPEPGTSEEAAKRTIRLDAEVRLDIPDSTWVVATARGARPLDDILPFMPIEPFAITNPIFVHR